MSHRRLLVGGLAVLIAIPGVGMAQTSAFDIAPQPLARALVAFALAADVSISAEAANRCGPTRGLKGRTSVTDALRQLLAGTGCTYRMADARTVIIVREPSTPRQVEPPALRTSAQDIDPTVVGDLLVTSPKRTIGLSRAPYALSAVDADTVEQAGEADMAALAGRVAGLTVTNLGPGRNKLFLRGLADGAITGRTQSLVGIYLDEMRTIYNAPDPDLRLTDVERVEVLRGPQGSLYGAGSIDGVVQIVTRAPNPEVLEGSLSGGVAGTLHGGVGELAEGVANAPLISGRLAVRLAGYSEKSAGYVDDPGRGVTNADGSLRQGLRAGVLLRISEQWRWRGSFIDQTIRTDDTHYSEVASGAYSRSLALSEPARNDFDGISSVLEGDLGWGRLKLSNAMQNHELSSRYDATLSLPQFSAGAVGPAAFDEANDIHAIVSEAQLTSSATAPVSWLAGIFLSEYTQTGKAGLVAISELYGEERRDHIDEHAAFGEATWPVSDRLRLTVGGRYYRLGVETRSTVKQPGGGTSVFEGAASSQGFAPKVLAEYDLTDNLLFYAQSAEGYRSGGFNTAGLAGQVFSTPGAGPQPYRLFKSDEMLSYEIGVRARLFDDRLRLRGALFHVTWKDIQSDRLLPNGLSFTANIGDGRNGGVELEASWRSGPWTIEGDLLLNDPELAKPDPGFPIPRDRHLSGIPNLFWNASAQRTWMLDNVRKVRAGVEIGYVGRSKLTFDAGLAPEMGGYFTSRLTAGLETARWALTAYVDNPLGQRGDTFAFGNPFRLRFIEPQTPQRPTTVGLSLRRNFGGDGD